ncbi:MAG: phosphoribosylformylglycinamidine synthase subunit PurQ [Chloroflexi bacterium]|nr:phosphoribosylformylglycinamidine synthase subunit PurQ [Chloroflexota bacterium]
MRFGVVVFPGTWSDRDFGVALKESLEQDVRFVWHRERDLTGYDCVVLPGGFAYGDYLRTGAIASLSPVMESVVTYAERGGLVLGSCNGFQILCEAGMLPGALLRNDHLEFRNEWTHLRVENADTPFTRACAVGDALCMPVSHGEGRYFADPKDLVDLELNGQVVFRYADANGVPTAESNPNGSFNNIAGIINKRGNVLGMMPHPERASSALLGGADGLRIFHSILGERTFA